MSVHLKKLRILNPFSVSKLLKVKMDVILSSCFQLWYNEIFTVHNYRKKEGVSDNDTVTNDAAADEWFLCCRPLTCPQ